MVINLLLGSAVFGLTVIVQVVAVMVLLRFLQRRSRQGRLEFGFWYGTTALSGAMLIMFAGHLFQVGLWAGLFVWIGEFQDFATAFYHSAVNFSSLGYGDIVMSDERRLLGALEAGGGILMFGLSPALGVAVISWFFQQFKAKKDQSPEGEL